jgi:DNA-binding transcriptional MocR family regulator
MTIIDRIRLSSAKPKYLAIADSIARGVEAGRIKAGERLPTQRELAAQLGVTIGTISRAYDEGYRRGLLIGEVGRGTYVRGLRAEDSRFGIREVDDPDAIDLSMNLPVPGACNAELGRGFETIAKRGRMASMLGYQSSTGTERHRAAGAGWMRRFGMHASADEVVLTAGAQHATLLALAALTRPGDVVLAEELTYPGINAAARLLHLRLEGVAIDGGGLRAPAFEEACDKHRPKALFCMPTMQNPTASVMPEARRSQIVGIARKANVAIIEDDTYGFLAPDAPSSLTSRAPELGYFITTLSKSVAPGVRIGYLRAPRAAIDAIANGAMATTWMVSPITAEIATNWIETGSADATMQWRRREAKARCALARRILGRRAVPERDTYHFWVPLPEAWRADELIAQAGARGLVLSAPEMFVVGKRAVPHAIRICLGAPRRRDTLERGLSILRELFEDAPPIANVLL